MEEGDQSVRKRKGFVANGPVLQWIEGILNYPYSVPNLFDDMEVWVDEMGTRRSRFGETAGSTNHRGLVSEQTDYSTDMIEHATQVYALHRRMLLHPRIKRFCWWGFKDASLKVPDQQIDWGFWAYHFTKSCTGSAIVGVAPDSWKHPILGYNRTKAASESLDFMDYYYGDEILHNSSFYAYKAVNRDVPLPAIPYILAVTVEGGGNEISTSGSCPHNQDIELTLSASGLPAYGTAVLKIDGIAVAKLTNQSKGTTALDFGTVNLCTSATGESLSDEELDTLSTVSHFHKLNVEFDLESSVYPEDFLIAETPHKFVIVDDDNDYEVIASFTFDASMEEWQTRSFRSAIPEASGNFINRDAVNGWLVFTGEGPDGPFADPAQRGSLPACKCCTNLANATDVSDCTEDSPYYDNHACEIDAGTAEWEGGEIWRSIDTSGYKNLILMYDVKTSGLHKYPHGPCVDCQFPDAFGLPYTRCHDNRPNFLLGCVDYGMTEEMLSVLYTSESSYYPPYSGTPSKPNVQNISHWKYADILSQKLLRRSNDWDTRVVEFSMHDETDYLSNGEIGLWIRVQLNSDATGEEDTVVLDNIIVIGQKE